MQLTNLSWRYLVRELKPVLEGSRVKKIQEVSPSLFKFRLFTKDGSRDLLVGEGGVFVTQYKIPARSQTSGFGAYLNKHLGGKGIEHVSQHMMDRVVILSFSEMTLVMEFVSECNLILLDGNGNIMSTWKRERNRARPLSKGTPYLFPKATGLNPADFSLTDVVSEWDAKGPVITTLIGLFNLPPFSAEAACKAAGIDKRMDASILTREQRRKLLSAIRDQYALKPVKPLAPGILVFRGKQYGIPFPLKGIGEGFEARGHSMNELLDETIAREVGKEEREKIREGKERKLVREKYRLQQQEHATKKFSGARDAGRKKGEWIYAHFDRVQELMNVVNQWIREGEKESVINARLAARPEWKKFTPRVIVKERKLVLETGKDS